MVCLIFANLPHFNILAVASLRSSNTPSLSHIPTPAFYKMPTSLAFFQARRTETFPQRLRAGFTFFAALLNLGRLITERVKDTARSLTSLYFHARLGGRKEEREKSPSLPVPAEQAEDCRVQTMTIFFPCAYAWPVLADRVHR